MEENTTPIDDELSEEMKAYRDDLEAGDPFDCLMAVKPGYVLTQLGDGEPMILHVSGFGLGDLPMSCGFMLDGRASLTESCPPIFFHKKMPVRHLGTLQEYLSDDFVQQQVPRILEHIDVDQHGFIPVIAVIEALRVEPTLKIPPLLTAVLERRQAQMHKLCERRL